MLQDWDLSSTQLDEGDTRCQSDHVFLGNGYSESLTTGIKRTQGVDMKSKRISMNSRITMARYRLCMTLLKQTKTWTMHHSEKLTKA